MNWYHKRKIILSHWKLILAALINDVGDPGRIGQRAKAFVEILLMKTLKEHNSVHMYVCTLIQSSILGNTLYNGCVDHVHY